MTALRLPRSLSERITRALRWRVDEATAPLRDEIARLRAELDRVSGQAGWTANEMERLQPHVAGLDARVEDLRLRLDDEQLTDRPGDAEEARSVLDEVRSEHRVVRERLTGVSLYEERLRQLEEWRAQQS